MLQNCWKSLLFSGLSSVDTMLETVLAESTSTQYLYLGTTNHSIFVPALAIYNLSTSDKSAASTSVIGCPMLEPNFRAILLKILVMFRLVITKFNINALSKSKICALQIKQCHSVFGIMDLIHQDKPDHFALSQVTSEYHDVALHLIKRYYLSEHVLVRSRKMDISNDCALDEYLISLLKQGNSLFAKAEDGTVAGLCVSFASSPVDPRNLRNYAFYRQDPNTKDFLYFTAKLQETPNLWEVYKQKKVYEIKMITVVPEFRRQGLAVFMAEKSKELAHDQGYNVIRMDCINPFDYKIAERCMLQCLVKFPLHKVRGANAPFIKRSSEYNCCVRVYVEARAQPDVDRTTVKNRRQDLESLIE